MKYAVVFLACVIAAASAQSRASASASFGFPQQRYNPYQKNQYQQNQYQQNQYQQNQYQQNQYQQNQYQRYTTVVPVPAPAVKVVAVPNPVSPVADARSANTVKYGNEAGPDGTYNYFFETDNGIAAQAQGYPRAVAGAEVTPLVQQGSFSWTSPEGKPIVITYVADENGYQPQGDSLPVPPPVPAQIQRALDYTAKYIVRQK